jgi:CxxC-x17-CxxC domain-containing protein
MTEALPIHDWRHRVSFTDKTLTCADCGAEFVFTSGEQEFHASKGFTNEPRRCASCRASRRQSRSGGDDYGRGGGYSGGQQREMFSAVCATCGNEARVPFEPRGDKPVYCSDCFRAQPRQSSYGGGRGDRW